MQTCTPPALKRLYERSKGHVLLLAVLSPT